MKTPNKYFDRFVKILSEVIPNATIVPMSNDVWLNVVIDGQVCGKFADFLIDYYTDWEEVYKFAEMCKTYKNDFDDTKNPFNRTPKFCWTYTPFTRIGANYDL